MKLAKDLNDFIGNYGAAMAAAADKILKPLYVPGVSPAANLSALERHRTQVTKKKFNYFPSQVHKISATLEVLKRHRRAVTVWEMGFGKSPGSLAIMHTLLKHRRQYRAIVMCPGHIVQKWQRETFRTIPGVYVKIVKDFAGLMDFRRKALDHKGPSVLVISKEAAKLGFDVDKPCAMKRRIHWVETIEPANRWDEPRRINQTLEAAACPHCGTVARTADGDPVGYAEYVHATKRQVPLVCGTCVEALATNARGHLKKPHLDRYIQRKMKGFFDLLIADEVHELASATSIQGNTFGTLSAACRYTIALTGTLIGGIATDLHAILWRAAPDLMRRRGFDLRTFARSRMGAIARNEKAFAQRYGVMEHKIERGAGDDARNVRRGACGRRKEVRKTDERVRPGISPELFTHFLIGRATFANLAELGPALPTIERILEPVKLDTPLMRAYSNLDAELKDAIQERIGNGPPVLAGQRVGILDAYADHPWGWEPIQVPCYEDGSYTGHVVVATPQNFEDGYVTEKDRRLLEIVKAELSAGRRCCIYPQYVQVRDVRPKIVKLLKNAGIRVLCLPDSLAPSKREEWVEEHVKDMDVLITQPKRVMTGLDLVQFPTLIWYEVGFQTHVLRQASARARRPIQTRPCKVYFLYSSDTIQEHAMSLMGEKEAASQALEGTFDAAALRALMNGGEDPDILAALARSIESGIDRKKLKAAWAKVDKVQNFTDAPDPTPAPACQPERTEVERTPWKRTATSSPSTTSTCSSAEPSLFDLVDAGAEPAERTLFALLED